jgi:hypothetical protein
MSTPTVPPCPNRAPGTVVTYRAPAADAEIERLEAKYGRDLSADRSVGPRACAHRDHD